LGRSADRRHPAGGAATDRHCHDLFGDQRADRWPAAGGVRDHRAWRHPRAGADLAAQGLAPAYKSDRLLIYDNDLYLDCARRRPVGIRRTSVSNVTTVMAVIAAIVLFVVVIGLRTAYEYERAVVFRLGRLVGTRGPGLYYLVPIIESQAKLDLRV